VQADVLLMRAFDALRQDALAVCKYEKHPFDNREEVSEKQLRDDLLSMLVAGHETTGSALTWTLHLLAANPDKLQKACPAHLPCTWQSPCAAGSLTCKWPPMVHIVRKSMKAQRG
jgi:hypothetical protein